MRWTGLTIMMAALAGCSDPGSSGGDGTGTGTATDATTAPDSETTTTETETEEDVADTDLEDTVDTLDTTPVDTEPVDTTPPIPDVNIAPDDSLCTPAGGDRNIYDLQNPDCPDHFNPEPVGSPGVFVALS